jgi:S1-C subfamily serine protease
MGNCRWPFLLVALLVTGCSVSGLQQRTTDVVRKGPDSITLAYSRLWGSEYAESEAGVHCERHGRRAVLRERITDNLDRHYVTYACDAQRTAAAEAARIREGARTAYRLGTGFAVRPDGLLVTAFHVIENARSVVVDCAGRRVPAAVEQAFSATDLATLRLRGPFQPAYLPIADARAARLGERVFTIGFPEPELLGAEPKLTEGVISSLSGPDSEASLMQITVPVHNGNSGGALVNERGEVVGVVVATASARVFLGRTGNPPQNVNWAVKGTYTLGLFTAVPTHLRVVDRNGAIERAIRASCMVISEVEN